MNARVARKWRGFTVPLCAGLCLLVTAVPASAADPAAWMYEPTTVSEVRLTLPPASIAALEADPTGAYVPGTFSIAATGGVPGSAGSFTAPIEVGIRLKGGLGSLRTLDEKAAFKIKVDEFVSGQAFLGLKKLTLNNMVQDPSMVHEALAYEAFRALGVPAVKTGFAYLRVNGEDFGLHLNVETLDKVALEKRFGVFASPPQHLYEGEYGADVTPARQGDLEVDEGKKNSRGDLEALVTAVNGGQSGWLGRVEPRADLTEMARMWAAEKYSGHWDGYSGEAGNLRPNNYFLYSDSSGRFQMFPWGTDQTWEERLPFDSAGGVLFDDCLADAGCEGVYRQAATAALGTLAALDLDNTARCTAARLHPWQELEAGASRHPFSAEQIAAGVQATREFVSERPRELAEWLGVATPPVPSGARPCPSFSGGGEVPPLLPVAPDTLTVNPSPHPVLIDEPVVPLRLLHVALADGTLKVRLKVPARGHLSLRLATGKGPRAPSVCSGHADALAAGALVISCRLSHDVRQELKTQRVTLWLKAAFKSISGLSEQATRAINFPRQ